MPVGQIGEKNRLDNRGIEFLELKAKGQKIQIRIIDPQYNYDGKHFIKQDDGRYRVIYCPRINQELHCDYCEKFQEIMQPAREFKKEAKDDNTADQRKAELKVEIEKIDKLARPYRVAISFYYKILDRADRKAKIFRTTLSTRIKLEEMSEMGVDILNVDFMVMRTEKPGSDYYSIVAIDSAKSDQLSEDELKEIERAKSIDLNKIVSGHSSEMEIKIKEDSEEIKAAKKISSGASEGNNMNPKSDKNPVDDMPF